MLLESRFRAARSGNRALGPSVSLYMETARAHLPEPCYDEARFYGVSEGTYEMAGR